MMSVYHVFPDQDRLTDTNLGKLYLVKRNGMYLDEVGDPVCSETWQDPGDGFTINLGEDDV